MVFERLAKPWGAILSGFDSQSLRHFRKRAIIGYSVCLENRCGATRWAFESPRFRHLGCWASGLRRRTVDPVSHGFESRTPRHFQLVNVGVAKLDHRIALRTRRLGVRASPPTPFPDWLGTEATARHF